MEILFKSVISIALVAVFAMALKWIWTHQLDPKGTYENIKEYAVNKFSPPDLIATRDTNGLYQSGIIVGTVNGEVNETDGKLNISRIIDTKNLNKDEIIEFQRFKLRFLSAKSYSGMEIGPKGIFSGVYKGVLFEIL